MLDTLENIQTPEGVLLSLRPAGPFPRLVAWLIDGLIKLVMILLTLWLLHALGAFFTGLWLLLTFVLLWGYNVLFEVLNNGATPGKIALNLQVVYTNGAPVSWSGSILRNFLRVVDALPNLYALGLLVTLVNPRFQRLGDIAAGTVVAYREGTAVMPLPAAPATLSAQPLRVPLSRDEQRAVMQFGERAGELSRERLVELAALLKPVTQLDDSEAVERLSAHASWLSGRT